jgi:NHS family xanthosine MFS transporter
VLGSSVSGLVIQHYFTDASGNKDWHGIWLAFAAYALVIAVLFVFIFKHKHEEQPVASAEAAPRLSAEPA